jgi:hypothetical protein
LSAVGAFVEGWLVAAGLGFELTVGVSDGEDKLQPAVSKAAARLARIPAFESL